MSMIAPFCSYCESPSKLVDSKVIYRARSYGNAYVCSKYPECDAYVGCHPGTDKPLGRLANSELREAKKAAHLAFDPIWQKRVTGKCTKFSARKWAYRWLAEQLGLSKDECHIGMFDLETCRYVVKLCTLPPTPDSERK